MQTNTIPIPIINGPNLLCTNNSSFTISDFPPGQTATWTVIPSSLVNVSSGIGTTATIRANSGVSGRATISFTLNGGAICPNRATFTKTFQVGPPSPGTISGNSNICLAQANYYSVPHNQFNSSYSWTLRTSSGGILPTSYYSIEPAPEGINGSRIKLIANNTGNYRLYCVINTGCNYTHTIYKNITVNVPGSPGCLSKPQSIEFLDEFIVYPNPANHYLVVSYNSQLDVKQDGSTGMMETISESYGLIPEYELKLFNYQQKLVINIPTTSKNISYLDTRDLPNGVYFLKVITKKGIYRKQILIEQ